ncbi:MAG: hypothetical protein LBJ61_02410 [Deltaproteobacteria bacterium]|jgi:hypothetical protein|nr:hypothetical protein [Deltaproteobacteria bacterium]
MTEYNYYFDDTDPLKPYRSECVANKGSLPPLNATRIAPPPEVEGKWRVFKGGKWGYVEDHRGEEGYLNGVPTEIKALGPYPSGWSATPPPPTAEEIRAQSIAECQAKLAEIDLKSTRSIRAIKVLEDEISTTTGLAGNAELVQKLAVEKSYLSNLETQAKAERDKLAGLLNGGE